MGTLNGPTRKVKSREVMSLGIYQQVFPIIDTVFLIYSLKLMPLIALMSATD